MTYSSNDPRGTSIDRVPVVSTGVEYHDRVRWGPILAGLFVAISSQLVLSGIIAATGLTTIAGSGAPRSNADNVGAAVGIGAMISLFIALFIGGWITARSSGPMNRNSALLNAAILWATTLAISAWLLSSGVAGAFGVLASNAGEVINQAQQSGVDPSNVPDPNLSAQQTRDLAGNAARVGWSFAVGSLLALIASLVGATVGNRSPRANGHRVAEPYP
jgi:hypothetical protein